MQLAFLSLSERDSNWDPDQARVFALDIDAFSRTSISYKVCLRELNRKRNRNNLLFVSEPDWLHPMP